MDAPGQSGLDAIIAVAGGQAADAANAVADGCGWSRQIEHPKRTDTGTERGWIGIRIQLCAFEARDVALPAKRRDTRKHAANQANPALNHDRKPSRMSTG